MGAEIFLCKPKPAYKWPWCLGGSEMCIRNRPYRGIILEAFGAGGLHFIRRDLSEKIRMLVQNGVAVVVCSQCLYDSSDFSIYEVGRKILEAGAIPAGDMTTEAAVTKLMWALGQTSSPELLREIFAADFAGEITLS